MSNQWHKLGLLYRPGQSGRHPKLLSHAANPLPLNLEDDLYRIYYCGRDEFNRSSVGAVDIDILRREIVQDHGNTFFEHGPEGSFYADGVSIGNCYEVDGVKYMLFMGWQNPPELHWRGDIGRLVVKPDLTLELDSEDPLMGSDDIDPISLAYPWIMQDEAGGYRMWYPSTISWDAGNGEMLAVIHFASSENGHDWKRHGIAVPYALGTAQAFSRPTVIGNAREGFEMWFSYRGDPGTTYRIGYATSRDGLTWKLALDNAGISVSPEGWDSEMIEYPFVIDHKGRRYMLYNGNGYGKTGFGMAVLEQ